MKPNGRAVLLVVVCVVAIGLAAATLPNPDATAGSGGGFGGGSGGSGVGAGNGSTAGEGSGSAFLPFAGTVQSLSLCYPFLTTPAFLVPALLAVALLLALVYWRTNALVVVALLAVLSLPTVLVYSLLTACTFEASTPDSSPANNTTRGLNTTSGGGGGGGGADAAIQAVLPTPLLVALFVLVLGVTAFVLLRATGDDVEPDRERSAPADTTPDLHAVGRAAGDAADRIEAGTDVDNEVYRAWRELTGLLDVDNPATTTPAEFADAARDAGMRDEDVTALTDVFREVRYGGADPASDDREARAVAALRAIEDAYTEEGV